jgi:hypothetical protein
VPPGHETSTHYFSRSGGTSDVSVKSVSGQVTSNFCFFHLVGYPDLVVHFGAFGARNVDALFFMLGWECCDFHKKHVGTSYIELVFLHLVGYVGHVVHSGASRMRNVDALFYILMWDRH